MSTEPWVSKVYLVGRKINHVTILSTYKTRNPNHTYTYFAVCRCDCGTTTKPIRISDLRVMKSCGCIKGGWPKGKPRDPEMVARVRKKLIEMGHKPPTNIRSSGECHPNWKGGVIYNNGYRLIKSPSAEHPYQYRGGYVYEHRYVVEQEIGRYLDPSEKVHHRNGDITDNRLDNLVLCQSNSDHFKKFHSNMSIHERTYGPACPRCSSKDTVSRSQRRWHCKACGRDFSKSGQYRR